MSYKKLFSLKMGGATVAALVLSAMATTSQAAAAKNITLIQLSDLHGNLVPHAAVIDNIDGSQSYMTRAGGVAKTKTLINQIRAENPNNLLLAVGDTTQGNAEVLFTVGDAIMPTLNSFAIDAFTPGNWDFMYGPAVTRGHFSHTAPLPPIPANLAPAANAYDGAGVTKANFPSLAINLYNDKTLPPQFAGQRVWDPYKIFTVDGVRVAVIGITSAIVPNQNKLFTLGFRFTQGVDELPSILQQINDVGADLIVVMSELGLAQNIQIGREFKDIDIVLSAHTHEVTLGAVIATATNVYSAVPGQPLSALDVETVNSGGAIIVEAGEDLHLGRLDLEVRDNRLVSVNWKAIPVDDNVAEDPATAALVEDAIEPFVAGKDGKVERHSFLPGGYCPANNCGDVTTRGLQLVDDLNMVIGKTDVLLQRHDVLEGVMNNALADGVRDVTLPYILGESIWADRSENDVFSMTNGFRFDTPVLPASLVPAGKTFFDGRQPGEMTLRDLFAYFPIPSAVAVAEFKGSTLEKSMVEIIGSIFDRNPYRQAGGWYISLSKNVTQKVDVENRPGQSKESQIVETKFGNEVLDPSKSYIFVSCYSHGFELGHICRTQGGFNTRFFELANADDYNSLISVVLPQNTSGIVVGNAIKQVAPDRFLSPIALMRRYIDNLPNRTISESLFGTGRVTHVNSLVAGNPASPVPTNTIAPEIVQPIEGAGPQYMGRTVVTTN